MIQAMQALKTKWGKRFSAATLSLCLMIAMAVPAFAAGTEVADADTVSAVTSAMTIVKLTAVAILAAVAVIAIVLFGGIYGWRYGKKVFTIIAK
ncbi:hypothetical protein ACFSR7_36125 [Cohnella sp. GCM10020058]|uniref:hypothetical protein n=1 Tax=Cohnella sp. GCM10020058 TaxID=3317330 RepID=UPI003634C50B